MELSGAIVSHSETVAVMKHQMRGRFLASVINTYQYFVYLQKNSCAVFHF